MLENKTNQHKSVDLSSVDPFYKAAFTTQISRVRFNQEQQVKRRTHRAHNYRAIMGLFGLALVI
jgi:hypothetical protein